MADTSQKEQLLAAIAAAGTQGKVDFEQAQAANQNAQAEAIRAALANSAALGNPSGIGDLTNKIIGQPYQVANTHLAANEQAQETWMNHAKYNSGIFQYNIEHLRDALIAQTLAEQAGGGGSGGGGSGGGGGGADPGDWYDNLKDAFGTAAIAKQSIAAEAQNLLGSYKDTGLAPYEQVQKYAQEKYGVPAGTSAAWYGQPKDDVALEQAFSKNASQVKNKKTYKQFIVGARTRAKKAPGNQKYLIAEYKAKAKQKVQPRRKKR